MNKALLIVDVQNDFCSGGSLAVKDGDQVVPELNKYIDHCKYLGYQIIASRDWHPYETNHFKDFGGNWPIHCVAGTKGAEFHPYLKLDNNTIIISKGTKKDEDAYSAFQGTDKYLISLHDVLYAYGIKEITVGGLATDYCVKSTVLSAISFGYKVNLIINGCRAVNLNPDDGNNAIKLMREAGAELL